MYHPVIGLIVFGLITLQPIGGCLGHLRYKRTGRSSILSSLHVWIGRFVITLGMINGGLGLLLAGNSTHSQQVAYGVVAGFMWLVMMLIGCCLRGARRKEPTKAAVEDSTYAAGDAGDAGDAAPPRRRGTILKRNRNRNVGAVAAGAGLGAAAGAGAGAAAGDPEDYGAEDMIGDGYGPMGDRHSYGVHSIPPLPAFTATSDGDRARTPLSLVTEETEWVHSPVSPVSPVKRVHS
jgi:hypothetical protein